MAVLIECELLESGKVAFWHFQSEPIRNCGICSQVSGNFLSRYSLLESSHHVVRSLAQQLHLNSQPTATASHVNNPLGLLPIQGFRSNHNRSPTYPTSASKADGVTISWGDGKVVDDVTSHSQALPKYSSQTKL
jgi:hypothetical protein